MLCHHCTTIGGIWALVCAADSRLTGAQPGRSIGDTNLVQLISGVNVAVYVAFISQAGHFLLYFLWLLLLECLISGRFYRRWLLLSLHYSVSHQRHDRKVRCRTSRCWSDDYFRGRGTGRMWSGRRVERFVTEGFLAFAVLVVVRIVDNGFVGRIDYNYRAIMLMFQRGKLLLHLTDRRQQVRGPREVKVRLGRSTGHDLRWSELLTILITEPIATEKLLRCGRFPRQHTAPIIVILRPRTTPVQLIIIIIARATLDVRVILTRDDLDTLPNDHLRLRCGLLRC
uniref:Putative secreted peptide n=1 Tax=Anopheles braziliensis TaxID=58242 RepID=A0A2M3ZNU0_9DIPT